MAAAADIVEELSPDVCDINMGCPANKVLKGCAGAALMGDPMLARRDRPAGRRRGSRFPLTVKFRLGLDESRKNFLEIGRICAGGGRRRRRDARTHRPPDVHGTRRLGPDREAQGRALDPRRRQRRRRDRRGRRRDVRADRLRRGHDRARHDEEPVDLSRRSRGPSRRPAAASRRRWTSAATSCWITSPASKRTACDPREALHKLRTMTGWYTRGLPNGRALRVRISELRTPEDFRRAVEDFFARPPEVTEYEQGPVAAA